MSTELIVHHYDASPFSEKVRISLGIKGLAWRSVEIPAIMPKPDYVLLTGGYRRTPSLQVGADIYCDSQIILAEIDRRRPDQTFIPPAAAGLVWAFNWWADRLFFQTTVPIVFGTLGEKVPEAFVKDRERLSGRPFDPKAMKAVLAPMQGQWRAQAAWLERQLAASRSGWLLGPEPSLADAAAYMNVWFLGRNLEPVLETLTAGLPRLGDWRRRMAALGCGAPSPLSAAEAITLAKAADPLAAGPGDDLDPLGAAPGEEIVVAADDYGRDPVRGVLVAADSERVILAREHERTGRIHVHFPRTGYIVHKA